MTPLRDHLQRQQHAIGSIIGHPRPDSTVLTSIRSLFDNSLALGQLGDSLVLQLEAEREEQNRR